MLKKIIFTFILSLVHVTSIYAYGALAIDSNQGQQYGFSYNHSSQHSADNRALNECGGNCQIVQRFSNQCAAYAADQTFNSTVYGWATAASASTAKNNALQHCRRHGGQSCLVRVWGCE